MVAHADVRPRATWSLWLALVSGPVAWIVDEGIALVVNANVCSGTLHTPPRTAVHVGLALVGVVALGAITLGAVTARRWLADLDAGAPAAVAVERARFLAHAALLFGSLTAFGVLLRLVASLTTAPCA